MDQLEQGQGDKGLFHILFSWELGGKGLGLLSGWNGGDPALLPLWEVEETLKSIHPICSGKAEHPKTGESGRSHRIPSLGKCHRVWGQGGEWEWETETEFGRGGQVPLSWAWSGIAMVRKPSHLRPKSGQDSQGRNTHSGEEREADPLALLPLTLPKSQSRSLAYQPPLE